MPSTTNANLSSCGETSANENPCGGVKPLRRDLRQHGVGGRGLRLPSYSTPMNAVQPMLNRCLAAIDPSYLDLSPACTAAETRRALMSSVSHPALMSAGRTGRDA